MRIGGLVGTGLYGHEDVNDVIADMSRMVRENVGEMGLDDWSFSDDEITGGSLFGGSVEYLPNPSICIGVEFMPLSSEGGWDFRGEYSDPYEYWFERDNVDLEATGSLLSTYLLYRRPLGDGPVALRVGGGVDYVAGAKLGYDCDMYVEYWYDYEWVSDVAGGRDEIEMEGRATLEASGSGFGFHGRGGIEYQMTERFMVVADAALRLLEVKELELDDVGAWVDGESGEWVGMEEGKPLKWACDEYGNHYFSTEDGSKIGLDFGGLYLRLAAYLTF